MTKKTKHNTGKKEERRNKEEEEEEEETVSSKKQVKACVSPTVFPLSPKARAT